tara:strand:+ start:119 stop:784 length:666 start_codon:yes stop_codon:yes gene_type:complete
MQQFRTRIKICGITNLIDAQVAIKAGVDALGFVFYPHSKRDISISTAADFCNKLPPFVDRVGLFVDPSEEDVKNTLDHVSLSLLQFHGNETPEFCESFSVPYIKSIPMSVGADIENKISNDEVIKKISSLHTNAAGFLLDSYHKGLPGGSGVTFDWSSVKNISDKPMILAGGLNKDNICKAISSLSPYAVDVSSGVESGPGKKDSRKIFEFVQSVRSLEIT